MNKLILSLVAICLSTALFSQPKVYSLSDLDERGISMQHLDSLYRGVPSDNTIHPVFTNQYFDTVVHPAFSEFIEKVNKHLVDNGFRWGFPIRCMNRVYFDSSGKIDYYVFIFKGIIGKQTELDFKRLVSEFIRNYKLPVIAHENFSFTTPVMYQDRDPDH